MGVMRWALVLACALIFAAGGGAAFQSLSRSLRTAGRDHVVHKNLKPAGQERGPFFMANPSLSSGEKQDAGYYLIWSRGLLRRTATILLGLFLFRSIVGPKLSSVEVTPAAPPMLAGLVNNLVLPLFSSACCGIQLMINTVAGAGGCAGFNKTLGPLRPYFLSIMLYAVVVSMTSKQVRSNGSVLAILTRLVLAFLPEVVHVWNVARERINVRSTMASTSMDLPLIVDLEHSIPSMGCVACINKINSSIQKHLIPKQIKHSRSWLIPEGGGRSSIQFLSSSKEEAENTASSVAQAIRDAGFDPCIVESMTVNER